MSRGFEMPVTSVFYLRGQGMILAGVVRGGVVMVGDRLAVSSPRAARVAVVVGLETVGTHELIATAKENDEIAICFRGLDADDFPDGLQRTGEHTWTPLNLTVRSTEPLLSRLWKRISSPARRGR
jgi:translation elongation factor EF-Tu-like GTPase